nr:Chain C, Nonstructural protein [Hepacivirus hominis]4K8B_D Chain D, Nonstructural protein [Hepacivirus hominis]
GSVVIVGRIILS